MNKSVESNLRQMTEIVSSMRRNKVSNASQYCDLLRVTVFDTIRDNLELCLARLGNALVEQDKEVEAKARAEHKEAEKVGKPEDKHKKVPTVTV